MINLQDYPIHPLAQKVPQTSAADYQLVKASIMREGQQFPIVRDKGLTIDGRTRLRICCELGVEPRFEEYSGTLPVEQYILVTNLRRNLTKLQREQMMADFAPVIFPQVEAEMKERKKSKPGHAALRATEFRRSFEEAHPGNVAIQKATGATREQAVHLKTIHTNAPELLSEVAARGGLNKTAKEARKRKGEKARISQRPATKANCQPCSMDKLRPLKDLGLTPEQVDPELADKPFEFARKYGHVNLFTKEQIEEDREKTVFGQWIAVIKDLKRPLEELLKIPEFSKTRLEAWLNRTTDPLKHAGRLAWLQEMLDKIKQAAGSVNKYSEWLAKK